MKCGSRIKGQGGASLTSRERGQEGGLFCSGRVGLMVLRPTSWLPLLVFCTGQSFSGP